MQQTPFNGADGKCIPGAPCNVSDGKKSACRHALNGFRNIEITPSDEKQNFQLIPVSGARGACRHALNGFKNIEITPLDDKQNFQPIPESGARGSRHFRDYILNTFEDLPHLPFRTAQSIPKKASAPPLVHLGLFQGGGAWSS